MTKLYAQTLKELETLAPKELLQVYEFILSLKHAPHSKKMESTSSEYLNVREALQHFNGSLAEDIIAERGGRL